MNNPHSISKTLISQLNITEQKYQNNNTPELAYERASIRLELAEISKKSQEKQHFVNQSVIILEQALISFDDIPFQLYLQLSLLLGESYLSLYHLTQKTPYLTIAEQIIKPLAHHNYRAIYLLLAKINQLQNKPKLSEHWQNKAKIGQTFVIFDSLLASHTLQ